MLPEGSGAGGGLPRASARSVLCSESYGARRALPGGPRAARAQQAAAELRANRCRPRGYLRRAGGRPGRVDTGPERSRRLLRSTTPGRRCAARCLPGVPCIPLSRLISRRWRPPRRDESVCRVAAMAYVWHQTPSTREYAVTATRTQATSRLPRRGRLRRRPHTRPSTVTDNDRHNTQPLHALPRPRFRRVRRRRARRREHGALLWAIRRKLPPQPCARTPARMDLVLLLRFFGSGQGTIR